MNKIIELLQQNPENSLVYLPFTLTFTMQPSNNNNQQQQQQISSYYNPNSTNWNTINQQLTSTIYQPKRPNLIPVDILPPTQSPLIQSIYPKIIAPPQPPPPILYPIPPPPPPTQPLILSPPITKGICLRTKKYKLYIFVFKTKNTKYLLKNLKIQTF